MNRQAKKADKHMKRQADKQMKRQTDKDKKANRQTDRQTKDCSKLLFFSLQQISLTETKETKNVRLKC